MRSFKWQALFAAAVFAVPSLALAQSENINQNQNENQNQNQNENQNDPFYATRDVKPKVNVRVDKRVDVKPLTTQRKMVYTQNIVRTGRSTDSALGLSISTVPPAMASQLRLDPGVGVVVEQIAPGSAIESAGVEQYDVIEKVDHHPIHQVQELAQSIRDGKSDSVSLDIVRQGRRQSVNVDRRQARRGKGESSYSFSGANGGGAGMEFRKDGKDGALELRGEQFDRDREQADKQREKADRDRDRELQRADRDRDRANAKRDRDNEEREKQNGERDKQNGERDKMNAIREQIKSQLDRQHAEIDRAREQLNRATQAMNQRLNELRQKLDTEIRTKMETELRKGSDQIREKMQLLEEQSRKLELDEPKGDNEKN